MERNQKQKEAPTPNTKKHDRKRSTALDSANNKAVGWPCIKNRDAPVPIVFRPTIVAMGRPIIGRDAKASVSRTRMGVCLPPALSNDFDFIHMSTELPQARITGQPRI